VIDFMSVPVNAGFTSAAAITIASSQVTILMPRQFAKRQIKWPKKVKARNTKGGSITVPLASCLTGLESAV
jgi:MFS superfamily sulfate permease-like transporter